MNEEQSKVACAKCKFKIYRYNKKRKRNEHFCLEGNDFMSEIYVCPFKESYK